MSDDLIPSSNLPATQMPENSLEKPGISGHFRAESGDTDAEIDPDFHLTGQQHAAIILILQGQRWNQISQVIGVDPKTLWRWRKQDPAFQQALAASLAARHSSTPDRHLAYADRAAEVLAEIIEDAEDKHRIRAAQILLQTAARQKPANPRDNDWPEPELDPDVG